jgi:tetratricopeptide (TPR) repeat protein
MRHHGNRGGFMRGFTGASLALAAVLAVGCAKVGELQAMRSFKAANQAYTQQNYVEAARLYEEAVAENPELAQAYFFLGNSYDNQFRPSRRGEAANDQLLEKAVTNYSTAADKLAASENPDDKKLARLSLEYLVAAYGADKMNDPARAEPVVQRMIQLDPNEPSNYFALAKIYEDAGAYAEAEEMYTKGKDVRPNDATGYLQLAGYYNRQGQFDKTIEALEQRAKMEPDNPEAFQTIAGYYWDETTRDPRLNDQQKREYVAKGVEAVNRAIELKADYVEALTFKNLLFRLQANLEKDPAKQQALIREADQLRDRANELRKKQTAGAGN